MVVHKRFTTGQIQATAGISESNLRNYIKALRRAGYLRLDRPAQSGKTMGHAIWYLARYTGPLHPIPRSDGSGVWDQNQQQFYTYPEAQDGLDKSAEAGL